MWEYYFGGLLVIDKLACESLYEAYLGPVPTLHKLTGVYDDYPAPKETGAGAGYTVIGVFTTVTPGAAGAAGPSKTASGTVETQTSGHTAARELSLDTSKAS